MKRNKEHRTLSAVDHQSKAFFAGGKFTWAKNEAEIWAILETRIDAQPKGRTLTHNFSITQLAIAASFAVLIALGSFIRFYTIQIETSAGQHQLVELPDHSTVNLNAQSTISFNPYWWKMSRNVKLEGEGFFEVEKGKKFTVLSYKGTTEVLGTSFNILSRDSVYKVTCITGSVKVKSNLGLETILKPNSKAEIQPNGKINVISNIETLPEISWRNNIFLFTASPIREVFYEIERQYGVKITSEVDNYSLYSGNFTKDQNVEEILQYVCPALGLKYIRKSAKEYLIIQNNE